MTDWLSFRRHGRPVNTAARFSLALKPLWRVLNRFDLNSGPLIFVQTAALLSIWIATHPYRGIIHDARLYTIQGLNAIEPGRYSEDLYFKFGSQDSLTLFSHVYGPLLSVLGLEAGHFCATVLGAALWMAALIFFVRSLFCDRREALAAVLACVALDAGYGGLNVFHYGEGFTTPRIFAEALVMAALALCLRGRGLASILCLAGASAIHPIMAATGIAVVGTWAAFEDTRARLAILFAVLTGILLAVVGVQPFARLLVSFDPDWFDIVWKRCGFGFLSRWNGADALHLAAVASTLLIAHALGDAVLRRLIVCVAISSCAGLFVTFVGGDLLRNVFLVNIQAWRMLWLDTLIANAAIAIILIRLPKAWFSRELFLWAAGLSLLTTLHLQLAPVAALAQLIAALAFWAETGFRAPLPKPVQLLLLIVPIGGGVISTLYVYETADMSDTWRAVALTGLAGAAFTLLALCAAGKPAKPSIICIAAATVLAGVALFDQRTSWRKFVESNVPVPALTAFAGGNQNIYWDGGLELLWFKLAHPSYYSCPQGTGAMFYKGTAMEYVRRSRALSVLNSHDFSESDKHICFTKPFPGQDGATSSEALKLACQALPELDAIVLPYPIAFVRSANWLAPVEREYRASSNRISYFKNYYKFSCGDFR